MLTIPDRATIDAARQSAWRAIFDVLHDTGRLDLSRCGDIATTAAMAVDLALVREFDIPDRRIGMTEK